MGTWVPRLTWWRILAALALVIAVIGPFRFGYFSVCADCGAVRNSDVLQLPLVPIPYWWSHDIHETALSRTVARLDLIGPHTHRWMFGHGGGNGVVCALGPGHYTRRPADSNAVATFLENTRSYAGEDSAREWLAFVLNPEHSSRVSGALVSAHFPEAGCSSKDEYRAWRVAASDTLDDLLGNPPPVR